MLSKIDFYNQQKQFMIDNYHNKTNAELAVILNRTVDSIKTWGHQLGLKKIKVKVGDKFGKLEVKEKLPNGWWKCQCKCGIFSKCETNSLTSGHSTSCGCGRIEAISDNCGYISGTWYSEIRKNARYRNLDFLVSKEYLNELFIRQNGKCAISGLPIEIVMGRRNSDTTASLDRINNELPYIESNVQFLHKHVNYMKWTHNQEYFLALCKTIAIHQEILNAYTSADNIKNSN